ncbi:unnamed protein product [Parajaminaea phylloscopi]
MRPTLFCTPASARLLAIAGASVALVAQIARADDYLPSGNNAFKNIPVKYTKKMQLVAYQDWVNQFVFDTEQTENHGYTQFVDEEQGKALGIVGSGPGGNGFRIGYDTSHQNQYKRNSVRLRSKDHFKDGVYVFTINKTPYGCGAWPSVFTQSERSNSDFRSEIDILEYANGETRPNALVIHTQGTCDVPAEQVANMVQNDLLMKSCTFRLGNSGRRGCGVYMDAYNADSFAVPKNMNLQQTILVMERSKHSINSWFWKAAEAPQSLQRVTDTQSVSTREFGKPNVSLPSFRTCTDDNSLDSEHVIVMMLEMCGSLPEFYWQKDQCPQKTGFQTCHGFHNSDAAGNEFRANGGGFLEFASFAYFASGQDLGSSATSESDDSDQDSTQDQASASAVTKQGASQPQQNVTAAATQTQQKQNATAAVGQEKQQSNTTSTVGEETKQQNVTASAGKAPQDKSTPPAQAADKQDQKDGSTSGSLVDDLTSDDGFKALAGKHHHGHAKGAHHQMELPVADADNTTGEQQPGQKSSHSRFQHGHHRDLDSLMLHHTHHRHSRHTKRRNLRRHSVQPRASDAPMPWFDHWEPRAQALVTAGATDATGAHADLA